MQTAGQSSTIAKNTLYLLLSRVTMAVSSLLLFVQAGRELGQINFGILTLSVTYFQIFFVAIDFGGGYLTVREVARDNSIAGKVFVSGLVIKIIPILCSYVILLTVTNLLYDDLITQSALKLVGLIAMFQALGSFFRAFFSAHEEMSFTGALMGAEALAILGIGTILIHSNYGVVALVGTYGFVYFVGAVVALILVLVRYHLMLTWDSSFTKRFFRQSLPFISFMAFGILYSRMDTILLSVLAPAKVIAVAIYQASFKIIVSLDYLPDMLTRSAYPAISRAFKIDRAYAVALSNMILRYLVLLSVPVAFGTFVLADQIMVFIYDTDFGQSAIVMQILIWVVPLRYASFVFGIDLSATDNQKYRAVTTAVVFGVSIALNLIFIPQYGYLAAAIINLISIIIVFSLYYFFTARHFARLQVMRPFLQAVSGSVGMAIFIWFFKQAGVHFLVLIGMGVIVYFTFMVLARFINARDYQTAKQILRGITRVSNT